MTSRKKSQAAVALRNFTELEPSHPRTMMEQLITNQTLTANGNSLLMLVTLLKSALMLLMLNSTLAAPTIHLESGKVPMTLANKSPISVETQFLRTSNLTATNFSSDLQPIPSFTRRDSRHLSRNTFHPLLVHRMSSLAKMENVSTLH